MFIKKTCFWVCVLFPFAMCAAEAQCLSPATFDTVVKRTSATEGQIDWLRRTDQPPVLGGQWSGSRDAWVAKIERDRSLKSKPKAIGWVEQYEVLKKYPVVFGLEYVDKDYIDVANFGPAWVNVQDISYDDTVRFIVEKHKLGGIITIADHMPNFVTYRDGVVDITNRVGSSLDKDGNVIERIMPGGSHHAKYTMYLDEMAKFFRLLQDDKGNPIPVLFRPFHEMNGAWFWWGNSNISSSGKRKIVDLWKFTWNYLTHCQGLRNLVWVWSLNIDYDSADFNPYWPGGMYVDVVAMDGYIIAPYIIPNTNMLAENEVFVRTYKYLAAIAKRENKPMAIAEFGFSYSGDREPNFWIKKFKPFLNSGSLDPKPRYVLIWNGSYSIGSGVDDKRYFEDYVQPASQNPAVLLLDR